MLYVYLRLTNTWVQCYMKENKLSSLDFSNVVFKYAILLRLIFKGSNFAYIGIFATFESKGSLKQILRQRFTNFCSRFTIAALEPIQNTPIIIHQN